jgi:hypothetical protein|tara:strand:+ start:40555 stop:40758 length:204 start_codon:yes stop_codon:yes gene_type:complete
MTSKYKEYSLGVCSNEGVNIFSRAEDHYVYLSKDSLGEWHSGLHTHGLDMSEYYGEGKMVLPAEYAS